MPCASAHVAQLNNDGVDFEKRSLSSPTSSARSPRPSASDRISKPSSKRNRGAAGRGSTPLFARGRFRRAVGRVLRVLGRQGRARQSRWRSPWATIWC